MSKKQDYTLEELDPSLEDECPWYLQSIFRDLWVKGLPKVLTMEVPDTTKYMWLVYPMHTLATNRIISTVISRKTT